MSYFYDDLSQPGRGARAKPMGNERTESAIIPTGDMRLLLSALIDGALSHIGDEQGVKLIGALATLAKTLRETEQFNQSLRPDSAGRDYTGDDLAARLAGYEPTEAEVRLIRQRLKQLKSRLKDSPL